MNLNDTVSFHDVHEAVRERASRALPDTLVRYADLRFTPEGSLRAPSLPELTLNSWSKRQLAALLGVRWERWFSDAVSGTERAEETNRRLTRLPGEVKLRTIREERAPTGVVLRAMLGPNFSPIDDVRIFDTMAETFGRALDTFRFTRVDRTDATTIYSAVHVDVRKVGDDALLPGWTLRNSEVAGAALTIDDAWLRLACMNGLIVSVGEKRLLYRTHRKIDPDQLVAALAVAMKNLPSRWGQTLALMEAARSTLVPHPDAAIEAMLENAAIPRELVREAQTVALKDGDHSRYGVVQAVTYVAHGKNDDPELRFVLERSAGEYLMATEPASAANDGSGIVVRAVS